MEGEVEFRINSEKLGKGDKGTGWVQVWVRRYTHRLNFGSHVSERLDVENDTAQRED